MKPRADHYLDLRGAIPPISLLKVTQVFRKMKTNETLEILGRDPDTRMDIFKIIPDVAYEVIVVEETERGDSFRVQMKKRIDIKNK